MQGFFDMDGLLVDTRRERIMYAIMCAMKLTI